MATYLSGNIAGPAGRYQQAHFPLMGTMKEGTVLWDYQET